MVGAGNAEIFIGGGGGAGGFREGKQACAGYTAKSFSNYPLFRFTCISANYPITVGGGGPASDPASLVGRSSNSVFSTITSTGGGGGVANSPCNS